MQHWAAFCLAQVQGWIRVGFEVSLLERSLGLSQARADWVIRWLEKKKKKKKDLRRELRKASRPAGSFGAPCICIHSFATISTVPGATVRLVGCSRGGGQ